jgi:hypothetical protein
MEFVFVSDLFLGNGVLGGGELNNHELCQILRRDDHTVTELNSHLLTEGFLRTHKKSKFVFGNFLNVPLKLFCKIQDHIEYIIYEHDHKYLKNRNPAKYKDFVAPRADIVFREFYENAKKVLCQSGMHKNILVKNLGFDNIASLGGNLWSEDVLEYIRDISKNQKQKKWSIMDSSIPHKNTSEAIRYCRLKEIPYELISSNDYKDFLKKLSINDTLIFLPKTPETLSRISVEARMLGCKVVTNNLVGASSEEWFSLKGEQLISVIEKKRITIPKIVIESFENENTSYNQ